MIAGDNDSLEKKNCISEACIFKKSQNHTNENQMPEDAEDSLGMNNIHNKTLSIRVHPVLVHTVLQKNYI